MAIVRTSLTTVLAVLSLALAPGAASANMSLGANVDGAWAYPATTQHALLSTLHGVGFRLARFNVDWASVEPQRGRFRWGGLDRELSAIAAARLQPYPILDQTPAWARVTRRHPSGVDPRSIAPRPGAFAAFATAFARRYGVHGSYASARTAPVRTYEIWNEENEFRYYYPTSARGYAALYEQARTALHRVDRHATVVFGGLAAVWHSDAVRFRVDAFTRAAIRAAGRCPAAVGYHGYPLSVHGIVVAVRDFRAVLDGVRCRRTPIDLNEYDYVGRGDPAAAIASTARQIQAARAGVRNLMVFPAIPPRADPTARGYPTLVTPDGSLTSVGHSLAKVAVAIRSRSVTWPAHR
jgi:hypothetical protein